MMTDDSEQPSTESDGDKCRRTIKQLDEAMAKIKATGRRMHDVLDYDLRNPDNKLESRGGTAYLGEDRCESRHSYAVPS